MTTTESKQRFVQVGCDLLREGPASGLLETLKVTEVAARAGVSPGAIYYHWHTQAEFRQAVLAMVLSQADLPDDDLMAVAFAALHRELMTAEELVAFVVWDGAIRRATDPSFTIQISLWTHRADPSVSSQVTAHYLRRHTHTVANSGAMLAAMGRRCRSGVRLDEFAAATTAIFEGIAIRLAVDAKLVLVRPPFFAHLEELLNMFGTLCDPGTAAALRTANLSDGPSALTLMALGAFDAMTETIPAAS